jgi:hypothetical protein
MKNYKVTFTIFGETRRANIKADSIEEAQNKLKEAILNGITITDINSVPQADSKKNDDPGQLLKKDLSTLVEDIFTKFRGF